MKSKKKLKRDYAREEKSHDKKYEKENSRHEKKHRDELEEALTICDKKKKRK